MRKVDFAYIGVIIFLCVWVGFLRFAMIDLGDYAKMFGNMNLECLEKLTKANKKLICYEKLVQTLEREVLKLKKQSFDQMIVFEQDDILPSATVTVTCYNSHPSQTDSTPNITAFNTKTGPGTIAVSRDLLDKGFLPHSKVWIEGFGIYTVNDIMNKRYTNRVDIWTDQKAKVFKKEDVRIVGFCDCGIKSDA